MLGFVSVWCVFGVAVWYICVYVIALLVIFLCHCVRHTCVYYLWCMFGMSISTVCSFLGHILCLWPVYFHMTSVCLCLVGYGIYLCDLCVKIVRIIDTSMSMIVLVYAVSVMPFYDMCDNISFVYPQASGALKSPQTTLCRMTWASYWRWDIF